MDIENLEQVVDTLSALQTAIHRLSLRIEALERPQSPAKYRYYSLMAYAETVKDALNFAELIEIEKTLEDLSRRYSLPIYTDAGTGTSSYNEYILEEAFREVLNKKQGERRPN